VSAIPDRYRGSDPEELALCLLADVLDPPPPEQAAAEPCALASGRGERAGGA
jgi:hypothetical protein